ncbi:MAG: hypothetical protein F4Y38_09665 [Gemmatimonadetes bacterium]|nr:hypothetical protein [Gemmatimonadota bacterium]MYG84870.1 hypothetical protein [Gemmatimonadota bacterium]MYJ90930.1 hypothetical protein [Gemmatimonadota bacterium]
MRPIKNPSQPVSFYDSVTTSFGPAGPGTTGFGSTGWRRRILAPIALLLSLAVLVSCSGEGPTSPDPVDPPRAARINVVSGDGQRALAGSSLREPVVVQVLDEEAQPLPGALVLFSSNHGVTEPTTVGTGPGGMAATHWTLGSTTGPQTLTVTASSATTTVSGHAISVEDSLDVLFAPAKEDELSAIRADWASRDFSASGGTVELEEAYNMGGHSTSLRVVSHQVEGMRHFGAIVVPDGAGTGELPIIVYAHGGDGGVTVETTLFILTVALGEMTDDFVYVIPSFRDEPLRYDDRSWLSDGPASPWDRDVDDALSLVNLTMETIPEARTDRYIAAGASRGGGVAMLMGIRDERIAGVITFFGPTDFQNEWARDIASLLVRGVTVDLPGVEHLRATYLVPWWTGDVTLQDARLALIRRSPVLFAEDLPPLQVHHGDMDGVVSVTQAESMIRAMREIGRGPPEFEAYIYPGATHEITSMPSAIPRAVAFLQNLLGRNGE